MFLKKGTNPERDDKKCDTIIIKSKIYNIINKKTSCTIIITTDQASR